ncbi:FRG domain-containing protein [Cryobacterium roopkundense]|nr:FRG domain-containing protein [Cryobacterium roopkundense]MBB5642432.1 hypothetical protein [Cryobacterium roopkundense]
MSTPRTTITAEALFSSRELNKMHPATYLQPEAFFEMLQAEQKFITGQQPTPTAMRQQTSAAPLLFRGQSNHKYGLSASLHRFMRAETDETITEGMLAQLEKSVILEMQNRGLGRGMTQGELLMLLQHHGAPTRMIDVSDRPLEALYFAVEGNDATDGRYFILTLTGEDETSLSKPTELPWANNARGVQQSTSTWTQAVKLVEDRPLDARMSAQRGRFLVGGVTRSYSDLNVNLDGQALNAAELQDVSMLTIGFLKRKANPDTSWPALGWSIRIPAGWKARLRDLLDSEEGINHNTIYPDLSHVSWTGVDAARKELYAL